MTGEGAGLPRSGRGWREGLGSGISVACALLFIFLLCACVGMRGLQGAERTELYFGLAKPGGGLVSEREWQGFLDREITPRFPDGMSVLDARGHYRGADGKAVKEPSKVLILIHGGSHVEEARISEIIGRYKQEFRQESVLRCDQAVRAGF